MNTGLPAFFLPWPSLLYCSMNFPGKGDAGQGLGKEIVPEHDRRIRPDVMGGRNNSRVSGFRADCRRRQGIRYRGPLISASAFARQKIRNPLIRIEVCEVEQDPPP